MKKQGQTKGQALVEYVLLILVVMMATRMIFGYLPERLGILERYLEDKYRFSYRYGDQNSKGAEEGGYERHPRVYIPGSGNFRMFKRAVK